MSNWAFATTVYRHFSPYMLFDREITAIPPVAHINLLSKETQDNEKKSSYDDRSWLSNVWTYQLLHIFGLEIIYHQAWLCVSFLNACIIRVFLLACIHTAGWVVSYLDCSSWFSIRSVRLFYFWSTRGLSNSYFCAARRNWKNFRDSLKILFVSISGPCKSWTRCAVVWINKSKWLWFLRKEIPYCTKGGGVEISPVILGTWMGRGCVTHTAFLCNQRTRGSLGHINGVKAGCNLVAHSIKLERKIWYFSIKTNPRFYHRENLYSS